MRSWLRSHGRAAPREESKLSAVATRELRECFDALDRDKNDAISISELRAVLRQAPRPAAPPRRRAAVPFRGRRSAPHSAATLPLAAGGVAAPEVALSSVSQ